MANGERAREEGGPAADPFPLDVAWPGALRERERARIDARRRAALGEAAGTAPAAPVGVALSGGGIRSATFCLGVFQALAEHGLLRRIDLLSTVSGGGYFGAFLGRLFRRPAAAVSAAEVEEVIAGRRHPAILRNLRENGRYLAPNGSGDSLLAAAAVLRNWTSIQVVLLSFLLMIFLAGRLVEMAILAAEPGIFETLRAPLASLSRPDVAWSPWTILPVLIFAVGVLPAGWAYWFAERGSFPHPIWGGLVFVIASWGLVAVAPGETSRTVGIAALAVSSTAVLFWLAAGGCGPGCSSPEGAAAVRRRLSEWLRNFLVAALALLAVAMVDTLAATLYHRAGGADRLAGTWGRWAAAAGAALLSAVVAARRAAMVLGRQVGDDRVPLPLGLVAGVAATLAVLSILLVVGSTAHALSWGGGRAHPESVVPGDLLAPGVALGVAALFAWLFGTYRPFLNRSSHHTLYSARLTRAYLGASNPRRWREGNGVTRVLGEDDIPLRDYGDPEAGGAAAAAPLHFVNATVNETSVGGDRIQQADRKGIGIAVGPEGMSVGARHHAVFRWGDPASGATVFPQAPPGGGGSAPFRVFGEGFDGAPEALSLGSWIGISGAAFSTGLGSRTSLPMSVLAGLANVRLGYWWNPAVRRPGARGWRIFSVQDLLFSEILSRFPGPAGRRWYLTDGGHFENMGGYELIRRRVPWIVLVDAEADPDYGFEGLANLVRKARIDFGAEITFLDDEGLDEILLDRRRAVFGSLERLRRGRWRESVPGRPEREAPGRDGLSRAHAALARVRYADGEGGWLVYLKPTLTGGEPADVTQYHTAHPDFPHESTADQFFDEEQWESYRRLGRHVGEEVFGGEGDEARDAQGWHPRALFRGVPPG